MQDEYRLSCVADLEEPMPLRTRERRLRATRISGIQWASRLLGRLWSFLYQLWTLRNQSTHGPDGILRLVRRSSLIQRIHALVALRPGLSSFDQAIFNPVEGLLANGTLSQSNHWLRIAEPYVHTMYAKEQQRLAKTSIQRLSLQ